MSFDNVMTVTGDSVRDDHWCVQPFALHPQMEAEQSLGAPDGLPDTHCRVALPVGVLNNLGSQMYRNVGDNGLESPTCTIHPIPT